MKTFFRVQNKGISFKRMLKYKSHHEDGRLPGVACTLSAGGPFGGAPLDSGAEIVIFRGHKVADIYDGVVAQPVEEIVRFEIKTWFEMVADGSAYEYESWE